MLLSIVTGSIEGHVTDLDGLPIGGVALYIEPEDESYGLDWPGIPAITNALGEYSFSDLPPGEYEVGLWSTIAVGEHPYTAPSSPTPVLGDLLVGVGDTLYDVDFECWLPKQTIQVFFLGDDTGSHFTVNGLYFGAIEGIIETLQSDERFDWEFGIGRFEDFPEFSGDSGDLPFMLNQTIISDDDPDFDSLIRAAIAATHEVGTGGDFPESLNEGLYQSALHAGFSSDSLDGNYCQSVILVGTDDGTAYREAEPVVNTIYGVVDQPLAAFAMRSRTDTSGDGATIQEAIDALNYVGARIIGLKSENPYNPGFVEDGAELPAYALATGAVNYSDDVLSYEYSGDVYDILPGEPLVIHTKANDLDEILAAAIVNQVEYRPPLASIGVHALCDGEGSEVTPDTIELIPAAFIEYLAEADYIHGYEVTPVGDSAFFQNLLPNLYAVVCNGALTQTRVYVPSWLGVESDLYPTFLQRGPNSWETWVYVHGAAEPDMASTLMDAPVVIDVLANDGGGTIGSFSQPDYGSVSGPGGVLTYTPPTGWQGTASFTYTREGDTEATPVTIYVSAPRVTSVVVGNATFSDSIDASESSSIQLATVRVPYGVNRVTLTFVAEDLRIVDATRSQTYWADSCVENSVGQGSSVTWTFSETFADGEMYVWLNDPLEGRGVPLDGGWGSPTDFSDDSGNSEFPSGDGAAGGSFGDDFAFAFTILPGDATRNGVVDIMDLAAFAIYWYSGSPGASWEDGDFNGDGYVSGIDLSIFASYYHPYTGIAYWQPPEEMGMRGGGGDERSLSRVSVSVDAIFAKYGLDNPDAPKSWLSPGNETFDQFAKDLLDVLGVAI